MKTNLKGDLRKALSEPKPETPKTPKPKPEIRVSEKKLKKLRQDFHESRHKFSKKETDTEKLFMLLKAKNIFLNQKQRRQTKVLIN